MNFFNLVSDFSPVGDQPQAIASLVQGISAEKRYQTLLGITGSGKTFTMANVIQQVQRPTLIISHNKTLAAQLYSEFKSFFPNNAVEYFVSYYDYYQPEAYIPHTDTYIEKDASINEQIERLRLSATTSLLTRRDVVVVASVSCIYGLGSREDYEELVEQLEVGQSLDREDLLRHLVDLQYQRNDIEFSHGTFRVRGPAIEIYPAYDTNAVRIMLDDDGIQSIEEFEPVTGNTKCSLQAYVFYPAKHFVMPYHKIASAAKDILAELDERLAVLRKEDKPYEAKRLESRTRYDLEMLKEIGYCQGIENYSMHLSGRKPGDRPCCLIDFFPDDFLCFVDESHVTISQLRAMYNGDRARKKTLVEHGFRLPSALENRPLQYEEFLDTVGQVLFVSATPSNYEVELSGKVVQQVIRPTGILDPAVSVKPLKGQIDDLLGEIKECVVKQQRVLVTTLTKRMSEQLTEYLSELGIRVKYLHSEIDTIERVEILRDLCQGAFDVLIGINLLREGLDLPEVALVAILDADKQGFLRSQTALIQTAGRAARHCEGRVILYADTMTAAITKTVSITENRRIEQEAYNKEHGIVPRQVKKNIQHSLAVHEEVEKLSKEILHGSDIEVESYKLIYELEQEMLQEAQKLNFERAAHLRDKIEQVKKQLAGKSRKRKR